MKQRVAVVVGLTVCCCGAVVQAKAQRTVIAHREITIDGRHEDLTPVRGLSVSKVGVIAVVQPMDHQVVFFTPSGRRICSFGRKGEGPGEFGSMQVVLGWKADSVWVSDLRAGRTTIIAPGCTLVRTLPGPDALSPADGDRSTQARYGSATVRGRFADGEVLTLIFAEHAAAFPGWLPSAARWRGLLVARTTQSGQLRRIIATIPRTPEACIVKVGSGSIGIRYCDAGNFAIAPDGSRVILLMPTLDGAGVYQVVAINGRTGDTLFQQTYAFHPRAIPPAVIEEVRGRNMADRGLPPALRQAYRTVKYPSHYPPFSGLAVGTDGTIWLREHETTDGPKRWLVLDQKGVPLGVVQLPAKASLSVASLSMVWAVESGEDDVDNVSRFRVPWLPR